MRTATILGLLTLSFTPGCSTTVSKCLQTPAGLKTHPESLDVCEEAIRTNPSRQDVYTKFMELLRTRERYEEVAIWSRRVLEREPMRSDALYNLAFALRKNGNCKEALNKYQAYARQNPNDPDPYYGMGLCYEDLMDRNGALNAFGTYIKMEHRPSQQEWILKAKARMEMLGGTASSSAAHGQSPAQAAKPMPTPARHNPLASTIPADSSAVIAPTPAISPPLSGGAKPTPVPVPAPVMTDCSSFEKAIAADPFATDMYDKYAECAAKAGKHAEIISRMRVALRDNPDYSRGWYHLAQAFKAKGDMTQARSAFAKACSLGVPEACGQ